uniref:EKC/KEOPS complex subunit GON7 n=1 Tax=Strongyloides stercoralis TaxID=6248 RepID=A0A0K0DUS0_STRER
MSGDENAGSSILKSQLLNLQQKAASGCKPLSISRLVTNENKTLELDTNDLNDNIGSSDIGIETDITIPFDEDEISKSITSEELAIASLKRMVDHYKKLISRTQEEIDQKKEIISSLENQIEEAKEARDEFLNELQNVLDDGEGGGSHDNEDSEIEHSKKADNERTDEE